jgi:hypothetical protein
VIASASRANRASSLDLDYHLSCGGSDSLREDMFKDLRSRHLNGWSGIPPNRTHTRYNHGSTWLPISRGLNDPRHAGRRRSCRSNAAANRTRDRCERATPQDWYHRRDMSRRLMLTVTQRGSISPASRANSRYGMEGAASPREPPRASLHADGRTKSRPWSSLPLRSAAILSRP